MKGEMYSHSAADLFPMMSAEELDALAADIKANGLRHPIVLDAEGHVLDGRNRLVACKRVGVEPEFTSVNGEDPVAVVVSLNVKRRNLTKAQTAIVAAEACNFADLSSRRAANIFGVSIRSVDSARALVQRAPKAAQAVKDGKASLQPTYEALLRAEAGIEDERESAQMEMLAARAKADELERFYKDLLGSSPADIDPEPLRPEEVEIGGADIELASATDDGEPDELDRRPEVQAQEALVSDLSALATRLAEADPVLVADRFLDVSVLASRDAVRRLTQNATTWLRSLNTIYDAHVKEGNGADDD